MSHSGRLQRFHKASEVNSSLIGSNPIIGTKASVMQLVRHNRFKSDTNCGSESHQSYKMPLWCNWLDTLVLETRNTVGPNPTKGTNGPVAQLGRGKRFKTVTGVGSNPTGTTRLCRRTGIFGRLKPYGNVRYKCVFESHQSYKECV